MKSSAVVVAAALALTAAAAAAAAVLGGYDRVAHLLIVAAGKPHQEAAFKAAYFTRAIYTALIAALVAAAIAAGWSAYWIGSRFDRIAAAVRAQRPAASAALAAVLGRFRALDPVTKASLALVVVLQIGWCVRRAATLPVTYDEAWTFMNFTMRPVFASVTYYPAPNNHVLFSVLSNAAPLLPLDPMFGMRLISVGFAVLTTIVLCAIALRYWDETAVVVALALFVCAYPIAVYAVLARGYMMIVFFTAVCCGAVAAGVSEPRPSVPVLIAYVASAVLGFYTIPLFLYPFASVNAAKYVYAAATRRPLRAWLIADVTVTIATVVLYTPIVLVNGVGALTANVYVARSPLPVAIAQLPERLVVMGNWLLGADHGGLTIVLAIVAASLTLRWRTGGPAGFMEKAMAAVVLLPPVILIAHRTNPQQRTWAYLAVPLFFVALGLIELAIQAGRRGGLRARWLLPLVVAAVVFAGMPPVDHRFARDFVEDFDAEQLFAGIPAASIGSIAHDQMVQPYDVPQYFADILAYRAQRQRRDPVRTERVTGDRAVDADALVLSTDGASRVSNLRDYTEWRRNQDLVVYLRRSFSTR